MTHDYGCDMRGMLSFQLLWLLSKKPMHGDELADEIGKRRGDKPKPGTIYPALRELRTKGLITGKKTGKIITYSLTSKGKTAVKGAKKYFVSSFRDILIEK